LSGLQLEAEKRARQAAGSATRRITSAFVVMAKAREPCRGHDDDGDGDGDGDGDDGDDGFATTGTHTHSHTHA